VPAPAQRAQAQIRPDDDALPYLMARQACALYGKNVTPTPVSSGIFAAMASQVAVHHLL